MANDLVRVMEPGKDITGQATAAITGKRFLKISGARNHKFNVLGTTPADNNYKVAHASVAGARVVGVSKYDQPNIGGKVGVARGGIMGVTCAAAITAGTEVMSDATGQAVAFTGAAGTFAAGLAMDDAQTGTDVEILFYA